MTSTVLILGARGRFGSIATEAFAAAGWRVLAQRRRAGDATAPRGVEWLDCALPAAAQAAVDAGGADVVVHAMNPAYTNAAWQEQAPALMTAAIDTARALGAVLLFPGNVYHFGAGMPALLAEDTPAAPTSVKGHVRLQIEAQLAAAAASGIRSAVIRAGDFFGSGGETWFDLVIAKRLATGRMGYPGGLDTPTAWAYLPDLARTFVAVAEHRDALQGAVRFHFAGHTLSGRDWLETLQPMAEARGWVRPGASLKPATLPWPLIRAGGLVIESWASMARVVVRRVAVAGSHAQTSGPSP